MESLGRNLNDEASGVETRPRWGWLAVAAVAGLFVARQHPRATVALGLGLVCWRCWGDKTVGGSEVPVAEVAATSDSAAESPNEVEADCQGGWLLNLEPVPLVVREEDVPSMGQGQGDGLLNQEPGQAVEELDWVPPIAAEEFWLNEGVEIPDAVELPELEEPRDAASQGQAGV